MANTSRMVSAMAPRARGSSAPTSQVLLHGQRGEDLPPLGHLADAQIADAMAGQPGDVPAAKGDAARARRLDAGDGADQARLAGAVGADDGDELALLRLERDAVQRLRVAVVQIEPFDRRIMRPLNLSSRIARQRKPGPRAQACRLRPWVPGIRASPRCQGSHTHHTASSPR